MERKEITDKILDGGIIAILRVRNSDKILPAAKAIFAGGIKTIEVTMNSPNALDRIAELAKIEGLLTGAGTVTDAAMAEAAISAGAEFIVTPITKQEIITACHQLGKPVISGAFTPSEIFQSYEWGADIIKIFPADVLGRKYLKSIQSPFSQIKLMPTGGVTPDNIDQWYDVGAVCVGVGGSFTNTDILENEEWGRLQGIAAEFASNISHYKNSKKGN